MLRLIGQSPLAPDLLHGTKNPLPHGLPFKVVFPRAAHPTASIFSTQSTDEILAAATDRPLDPDVFKTHLTARSLV
jgi:hypothetical protein